MNRLFTKGIALVALVGALTVFSTAKAEAVAFTGQIDYTGSQTTDVADLTVASSVTFGVNFVVVSTGTFLAEGINIGESLTLDANPVTFRPAGTPYTPLWSDAPSGISFDLLTLSIGPGNTATTLILFGTGVFHDSNGVYDDTPGLWNMTINNSGGVAGSFSSSSAVPEPVTLSLLGLGLAGVAARRRATK